MRGLFLIYEQSNFRYDYHCSKNILILFIRMWHFEADDIIFGIYESMTYSIRCLWIYNFSSCFLVLSRLLIILITYK